MGRYEERLWTPTVSGPGLRTIDRRGGPYRAYLPDPIAGQRFHLDEATANDVEEAARALAAFDAAALTLATTATFARLLLRAESVASSYIEGLQISAQRLLRADAENGAGRDPGDDTARSVLGNIDAMQRAIAHDGPLELRTILSIHTSLLKNTSSKAYAGRIRSSQNWIGGSPYNPLSAAFVPPPAEHVRPLLEDLCAFANRTDLPAIVQAAVAHAQFETIHPFADGNGRTGRALIYTILRKRGLVRRAIPPISLILATDAQRYVSALQAYRVDGDPSSATHTAAINDWVGTFAAAARDAVYEAQRFEARVTSIVASWHEDLGAKRADAASRRLIDQLAAWPVLTIATAKRLLNVSEVAAGNAIDELVAANVLTQRTTGRRNRVFEARDILDAFTYLERGLASVDRDTQISGPNRVVPARPTRRHSP